MKSLAVGQLKGERLEAIMQPLPNLINYHALKLTPPRLSDKLMG
jgi:hypothetical protein